MVLFQDFPAQEIVTFKFYTFPDSVWTLV